MATTTMKSNGQRPNPLRQLSLAPSGPRQLQLAMTPPATAPLDSSLSRTGPSRPAAQKRLSTSSITYTSPSSPSIGPAPARSPSTRFSHPVDMGPKSAGVGPPHPATDVRAARRTSLDPSLVTLANISQHQHQQQPQQPSQQRAQLPKEPTIMTLTEKHSDLLRFIAQKEAKCLELRTQLKQHESDLLALKAKWERIVSRSNPGPPLSPSSNLGQNTPTSLGGIREGVGKILALGAAASGYSPSSLVGTQGSPAASTIDSPPARSRVLTHPSSRSSSSSSAATHTTTTTSTRLSMSSTSSLEDSSFPLAECDAQDSTPTQSRASSADDELRWQERSPSLTPHNNNNINSTTSSISTLLGTLPLLDSLPSSLGKKWGELQKTDTFVKQSKRASLILSDMSSALLDALAPIPPPAPVRPKLLNKPLGVAGRKKSALVVVPPGPKPSPNSIPKRSLLDDDLPADGGALGPVLTASPSSTRAVEPHPVEELDDDWNW